MVKKSYILFLSKYFIFTIFIGVFAGCSKIGNNIGNKNYKIIQRKINLFPLKTLAVLGLNTYIINNKNDIYLVNISANIKKYNWLIDTIKIKKSIITDSENFDSKQEISTNLYFSEDIDLIINVKKISDNTTNDTDKVKLTSLNIELPYFIAVNNRINNNIYFLNINTVNVNLNSQKPIKFTKNIKIKFNEKYLNKLEILIGFKHNIDSYSNLQKKIFLFKNSR